MYNSQGVDMPDGDKVHDKLLRHYQKPYKYLCEGKASPQESAWELMKALLKDIQKKGDNFIQTAQLIAEEIEKATITIRFQGNLTYLRKNIEKLVKNTKLPHYDGQTLIYASQYCLRKLQQDYSINNVKEQIIGECFNRILQSNFIGRLPLNQEHYAGIDNETLQQRIEAVTQEIQSTICKWSKKASQENSVKKLRLPRRQNIQPIDMNEDLS